MNANIVGMREGAVGAPAFGPDSDAVAYVVEVAGKTRWLPVAVRWAEGEALEAMRDLKALDRYSNSIFRVQRYERQPAESVRKVRTAAPEMLKVLDDLEAAFDEQIYPEALKEDFNAPDDRQYSVTITAKLWRAIGKALSAAGGVQHTDGPWKAPQS